MANSIGGLSVYAFDGTPQRASQKVVSESRPGASLEDYQAIGLKPRSFQLIAHVDYDSENLRATGEIAFNNLHNTFCTVVYNGRTWTNVFIEDVQVVAENDMGVVAGGITAGPYHLSVRF